VLLNIRRASQLNKQKTNCDVFVWMLVLVYDKFGTDKRCFRTFPKVNGHHCLVNVSPTFYCKCANWDFPEENCVRNTFYFNFILLFFYYSFLLLLIKRVIYYSSLLSLFFYYFKNLLFICTFYIYFKHQALQCHLKRFALNIGKR